MTTGELVALLTALSVLAGTIYTVWNGRRQANKDEGSVLWQEMINVVNTLRDENTRLNADNIRLRDRLGAIERAIQSEVSLAPPKVVDSSVKDHPNTTPLAPQENQE